MYTHSTPEVITETQFEYELFFNLSPDLLCIAGYDGYLKKVNPAVANTLEYSEEELYSRPINDFIYHEDQLKTSLVRQELTKAKPLHNFENRYVTKSGEIVWLSWTSFPVDSKNLIFAIAKNVTHKKRQEEDRSALVKHLTTTNNHLQQLSYTTSHNLRSPLNNLLSGLDLLDTSLINDDDTLELINILKLSGDYLKKTLDNYVDTIGDSHKALVVAEEVDINESLDKVLKSINSLVQTSKATIHTDFSELSTIAFNNAHMDSVFLNLITNSIKYARPDCLPVIKIHTEKSDGFNRLIFSDNGMGFDLEKVKDKLFGLHQKFHDHKDSKGIGLYLVHNHVTGFGGKITVESKVNEGAKFIISFKD